MTDSGSARLIDVLTRLGPREHLCLIYETQEEQFAAAIPFMRIGLERGEKCVYVADDNTADAVLNAMRATDIEVDARIQSGALSVITKQETYLKQGCFDPDRMIRFLKEATDAAKAEGFNALRVTGEMTWVLGGAPGVDRLVEYEAKLNDFFLQHDCLAVCQYNRKRFLPESVLDAMRTHPLVIYRDTICKNPYCITPNDFLQGNRTDQDVDILLENIQGRERAEQWLRQSQSLFHLFMNNSPALSYMKDEEGRYVYCSRAVERRLNLKPEDWRGKTDFDLFPLETAKQLRDNDLAVLAAGKAMELVETIPHDAGPRDYYMTLKFPFKDASGKRFLAGISVDITEHKQAEEALRESERKYRVLLENLPQRIFYKNRHSVYVSCNYNYARDLAIKPEEIGGKTDYEFYPRELAEKYRADDRRIMNCGETEEIDEEYRHGERELIVHTVKTPVKDDNGNVVGILGIFWDITEQRRAEQARAGLQEQLQHAHKMEAVGQLAGGVAHDFNNLLTVIRGHTDCVARMLPEGHPARQELGLVQQAVLQATGQTRSLLTFSRELPADKEPIDLCAVVDGWHELLCRVLPAAIGLQLEVQREYPLWVNADHLQLQQVVLNLAINARDAMPDGGTLRIACSEATESDTHDSAGSSSPGKRFAHLVLSDTGMGVLPEVQSRIFEPFFTTKPRGQGTGLGLSIAHSIVEDHSGRIEVQSEAGKGTTFTIVLPCIPSGRAPDTPSPSAAICQGQGELVLLAEDNPHVRGIIALTLESLGFEVLQADNGLALLEIFEQHRGRVRLLILDVDLPKRSGLDCLREIRDGGPNIPALIITGDATLDSDRLDSETFLLAKPFDMSELAAMVRDVLGADARQETPS